MDKNNPVEKVWKAAARVVAIAVYTILHIKGTAAGWKDGLPQAVFLVSLLIATFLFVMAVVLEMKNPVSQYSYERGRWKYALQWLSLAIAAQGVAWRLGAQSILTTQAAEGNFTLKSCAFLCAGYLFAAVCATLIVQAGANIIAAISAPAPNSKQMKQLRRSVRR